MSPRHLTTMRDLSPMDVTRVMTDAHDAKMRRDRGESPQDKFMEGESAALIFEKPSCRTRSSLEVAIAEHGGHPVYIKGEEVLTRIDGAERESMEHIVGCMERYYRYLIARVFEHDTIQRMAAASTRATVVNALCNKHHPLQALADVTTIDREFCEIAPEDRKVAFIGDGNNVATSLAQACALTGMRFAHARPDGFEIPEAEWQWALDHANTPNQFYYTISPRKAAEGAHVVYTDTFVSMGDEAREKELLDTFKDYQVTPELMAKAHHDAIFLHCLPAHSGQEVHPEVLNGPQNRIFDLAEDRMHTAAAVLQLLRETEKPL